MIGIGNQANGNISIRNELLKFLVIINQPLQRLPFGVIINELLGFAECTARDGNSEILLVKQVPDERLRHKARTKQQHILHLDLLMFLLRKNSN
jgi:hypothetical protein